MERWRWMPHDMGDNHRGSISPITKSTSSHDHQEESHEPTSRRRQTADADAVF